MTVDWWSPTIRGLATVLDWLPRLPACLVLGALFYRVVRGRWA